ncbi:hypothetical protein SEPCBS119000_002784 [Sporothrix epigloea]|uniref:BRCT domain-containing protein n=1 Tax=Sporothrix epigloea TaxID=1892477 RepID=A0ABP0DKS6_9PEZI
MVPQSPPKRMTRARAAAKALPSDSLSSTTLRASAPTASSRARKSSATATTASAAAKRKIRAEDNDTDDDQDELGLDSPEFSVAMQKHVRAIRGRPKKIPVDPTASSTTASTPAPQPRGTRPSRKPMMQPEALGESAQPPPSKSSATAPTASTLARATKKQIAASADDTANTSEELPKHAKRTRITSTSTGTGGGRASSSTTRISVRSATATMATRSTSATTSTTTTAPKKRVTFEEPEKENVAPTVSSATIKTHDAPTSKPRADTSASAGLKAKPVRRSATASKSAAASSSLKTISSHSRPASSTATSGRPAAPLSPKKVTQVRLTREFDVESEDELGADAESHLKPFERSPTKPALSAGVVSAEKGKTLASAGPDMTLMSRDITVTSVLLPTPNGQEGLLVSPARRLAQTTVKEGFMMSPARRPEGLATLDSVLAPKPVSTDAGKNAAPNTSMLQSPAKRFLVPAKNQNSGDDDVLRSPVKLSLLQTPAKRPVSPMKAALLLQVPGTTPVEVCAQKSDAKPLQTYKLASSKVTKAAEESVDESTEETDERADFNKDRVSDKSIGNHTTDKESNDQTESLAQMLHEMAQEAVTAMPESPSRRRDPERLLSATNAEECSAMIALPPGDPMDVDDSIMDAAITLTAMSPPKPQAPLGVFGLRAETLSTYHEADDDMDTDTDDTTRILFAHNETVPLTPDPSEYFREPKMSSRRVSSSEGHARSTVKHSMTGDLGFTPLADQLHGWRMRSPVKHESTPTPAAAAIEEQDEQRGKYHNETDCAAPTDIPEPSHNATGIIPDASDDTATPCRQSKLASSINDEDQADSATLAQEDLAVEFDEDLVVTEEDLDLAQEADDMSLITPAEFEEMTQPSQSSDDTISEASQEYGDENSIPIDPALLKDSGDSTMVVPSITPQRVLTRTFHTVSKVPLKQADDLKPMPRRRSMSLTRHSPSRRRSSSSFTSKFANTNLSSRAAVMSHSPSKREIRRESRRMSIRDSRRKSRRDSFGGPALTLEDALVDTSESEIIDTPDTPTPHISVTAASAPTTPIKNEVAWSTASTPARTPRRDLDPALLRGAVVFVDVHTTEGSDASAIFVELLVQMGAQCVDRWPWNPSSSSEKSGNHSRVGITHVVFKDGSRRTLDKVRESNGLVQCVGVSWVLDCERSNQWQEEAPYYIDTASVPRGGNQRRKSMEPQALLNMNGLVVETPVKQITSSSVDMRMCRTEPATPKNRRDSSLWMRTPENENTADKRRSFGAAGGDDQQDSDVDGYGESGWDTMPLLTPVPKTPAPEAIARYAAKIPLYSPSGSDGDSSTYYEGDGDDTLGSMQFGQESLVTRTCPPKQRATSYHGLGAGLLSPEKDQGVLMRLMAARRKSLQFAPKIGSPLSKAWN